MKFDPVGLIWDGVSRFAVLDRFLPLARRQFIGGREYPMIPHRSRSDKAQGLYFASIATAWDNLPERYDGRFPTPEHLRKWSLVQEGYATEHVLPCASEDQAREIGRLCRELDSFAVIHIAGDVLTIWNAMSQDRHHMGADAFNESMQKVLERVAHMIGLSVDDLTENAKSRMQVRRAQREEAA